jgi:parallel beta-helix repeat protein
MSRLGSSLERIVRMGAVRQLIMSLTLLGSTCVALPRAVPSAAIELYGTFHSLGIVLTVPSGGDLADAAASVEYRVHGSDEPYQPGHPLSRIDDTHFVGSLFWLEPGTEYEVRVTYGSPPDTTTLEEIAATRHEIEMSTPAHSYYAAPSGHGQACSLSTPCSLLGGLGRLGPGDELVLREGTYYVGEMTLARSGTASAPIVIRGYVGEQAVLDGADPAVSNWTPEGGGVYVTTVNTTEPHLVVAGGERLYPYQSLAELEDLRWDVSGFYANGTEVYVHLADGADPNGRAMLVSRYHTAFDIERSFVRFQNLTFRHYGQGRAAKAINLVDASDNLVEDCTFAINDTGIVIKGASHRNVIQNNEFFDTDFAWPWDAVKAGSDLETGGVRFGAEATGRGNVIRQNVFHDFFDGFSACPQEVSATTNETDVYGNLVYNTSDDGMETDGQCSNVRIWDNTFHDVFVGISLAPVYGGPVYAVRNLIYRIGAGNNEHSGSPFKFNSRSDRSGSIYLYHNTIDAVLADNDGLRIAKPGMWDLVYSRNNIWSGTAYALRNDNTEQPADFDYDALWTTDKDLVRWGQTNYDTLAEFTHATGIESQGKSVVPGFVDAARGNYTLSANSGLIDAGVIIPGINGGFLGTAPDIGAFEHSSCGASVLVAPALAR